MAIDTVVEAPEEAAFRQRVRDWLEANVARRGSRPDDDDDASMMEMDAGPGEAEVVAEAKAFQAKLFDAGLAGLTWPVQYGGQGLPNEFQRIFNEEAAGYDMPVGLFMIGLGMCGPVLLAHGTEAQKERYIRPLLRADEVWCQLFSEPGAGSDVASLQTRAVRDGDEWILSGQKVWTSGAHYCDYGIIIARTDPDLPKHRGISMFVVDMHSPGVTAKPLRQITGGANFNEVFFDEVRVPAENLVADLNEGWRAAITMLMNERVAIGAGGGGGRGMAGGFGSLVELARRRGLAADPVVRDRLADLYVRSTVLGYIGMRIREAFRAGSDPGPVGSIAKLFSSDLSRFSSDLGAELAGPAAAAWSPDDKGAQRYAMAVISTPGSAIAGGTSEIQRNIIGERVLGLPKEPQVDRDQPFKELMVGTQK